MKTRPNLFELIAIIIPVILASLLVSCAQETATPTIAPDTRITITTQPPTNVPTLLPTQQTVMPTFSPAEMATLTAWPTATATPMPSPTLTPYPTASAVQANAVAFSIGDSQIGEPDSLWVVNVDGSGEKKLIESIEDVKKMPNHYFGLQWSPDGKWLSYTSLIGLWIISPDGLVKRKILSSQDQSQLSQLVYTWSPDGSKIAYRTFKQLNKEWLVLLGLLDVATGEASELLPAQKPFHTNTSGLNWSPDGRYLLINKEFSFLVLDVSARKIVKELETKTFPASNDCDARWYTELAWSPDGQRFYYTPQGMPGSSHEWICITDMDGSTRVIDRDSGLISGPVWDKTGNFLYFMNRKSDLDINSHLMRYDVRTHETKELLSIEGKLYRYVWHIAMSPDGRNLALQAETLAERRNVMHHDLIIMNMQSLAMTTWHVDLPLPITRTMTTFISLYQWSSDNQNIIFFSGEVPTSDEWFGTPLGALYTLNINTGQTAIFSGKHIINGWIVSPIAVSP